MSIERRKLLVHLGAEIVLTPAANGMGGAIAKAQELAEELDGFVLQQFDNGSNPDIHRKTTALEVYRDTEGNLNYFVAAVGTGGTMTGTSEVLKEKISTLKAIAVEPKNSPVLSGGQGGPHKIQGIGAGFVPSILNTAIYDEVVQVADEKTIQYAKEVALQEGLLVGISAGANIAATAKVAARPENRGKVFVTILCDTAERYLSTDLFS
jgi:cysteine synthase A